MRGTGPASRGGSGRAQIPSEIPRGRTRRDVLARLKNAIGEDRIIRSTARAHSLRVGPISGHDRGGVDRRLVMDPQEIVAQVRSFGALPTYSCSIFTRQRDPPARTIDRLSLSLAFGCCLPAEPPQPAGKRCDG